jgi:hypothetical protein
LFRWAKMLAPGSSQRDCKRKLKGGGQGRRQSEERDHPSGWREGEKKPARKGQSVKEHSKDKEMASK